jgi:prevent-host-death family protein
MKVSVLEAQKDLTQLLEKVTAGEEVILTQDGQDVAKLVASSKVLPDLREFRASIRLEGEPLSQTVITMREEERY